MADKPIVIVGAGPAGLATALALHRVGHPVQILERKEKEHQAGSGLSIFAPTVKALAAIGVDTKDLGAPCESVFARPDGRVIAKVGFPPEVEQYGGGFFGLLRPELYRRLGDALPEGVLRPKATVTDLEDVGTHVRVTLDTGEVIETPLVIGADGIHSTVHTRLWGDTPIRDHQLLVISGYTFEQPAGVPAGTARVHLSRDVQGSYTQIRHEGRLGHQWWFVEAWDPAVPVPTDLLPRARELAKAFPSQVGELVAGTPESNVTRWQIRDRGILKKWSKGRITLAGDAAHATSPYAAYGAGMGIGDGYFLGQVLAGVDLADRAAVEAALARYEAYRVEHTTSQVQQAYILGQVFHHTPALLRPLRDLILNRTNMLQKQMGEKSPREITEQMREMDDRVFAQGRAK